MKKRLYNEYGAAIGDEVNHIDRIMQDASNEVTKYCLDNNLDLRDANSICKNTVDIMFAHPILKEGLRIKDEEVTDKESVDPLIELEKEIKELKARLTICDPDGASLDMLYDDDGNLIDYG